MLVEKSNIDQDITNIAFMKLLNDLQIIRMSWPISINILNWNFLPPQDDDESILFAITTPLVFEKPFPIPSGLRIFPDIAIEEEVPVCDDFTTVFNPLFDADDDFSFSNDKSFSDEDIPKEIYSNPLFDEEIIYDKIDASIISSPKFDSLLEDFSDELTHIDLIPPGINEADFEPEEGIPIIESFSPSPIPSEDSDSLMKKIDLFLTPDDSMPPGIENDDYDSEGDILFLEELLRPMIPLHFQKVTRNTIFDPGIFIEVQSKRFPSPNEFSISFICDPLSLVFDSLLPFSSKNEDNVFNPGILASNEEKSPHLLSHRGFKAFQLISESPMMISGGDIPILDVLIAPDYKASHARGFVIRSLELQILSFVMGIQYPNLID
ncbi:hypothetical protein Tco_1069459 [Tanacetum coccineum]|uniref:Reverse transcriptase domain-containing protein n=1 Tax=Tanacetum coccineum TaxID=301880 RepID=A0ABQ5HKI7_9ASTR